MQSNQTVEPQQLELKRKNIPWARLLARVFNIDIQACTKCGGKMKILAAIEDPKITRKILEHMGLLAKPPPFHLARGPPVADAVRSLAQKSAQSAKEINELIKEMVDNSTKGSKLADESGQVLDEIVKSIKQTLVVTKIISEASKEQSVGIKQVTETMNSIDRITQGNADTSNQVSENSGQMAGQAEISKDVVQELSMLIHGKNAAAHKVA